MLRLLFLLFIVTPLVELTLLLVLAEYTSWVFTLLLVIVTGVLGATLAKAEGVRTWRRIQRELQSGQMPADSLLDGVMIFVAGALLITPGVLTDVFGFSLLLPFCRLIYKRAARSYFRTHFTIHARGYRQGEGGETRVIDSYVVEQEPGNTERPAEQVERE